MTEPVKEILNIEEACKLLGVSAKTFTKILREGDLPGRKIGREWKFSRQALIDWVGAVKARDFVRRGKRNKNNLAKNNLAKDNPDRPLASPPKKRSVSGRPRPNNRFSIEED